MTERSSALNGERRPNRPSFKQLTADEAERALYLDFEGNVDQPPVLVDVLRRAGTGDRPFVQQPASGWRIGWYFGGAVVACSR